MIRTLLLALCALIMLPWHTALSHEPSSAYLGLVVGERTVQGRWDIALRDLERAIGIDRDGDGAITWGELRDRHLDIAAHALARLEIRSDGELCPARAGGHQVDRHGGSAYAVLRFVADCPTAIGSLDLSYRLLFDIDRLHRGLLRIDRGPTTVSAVLGPDRPSFRFEPGSPSIWRLAVTYAREGVRHIWLGFDHVLFLLALLLPAVAPLRGSGERSRVDVVELVKAVSAFTVAHSITLVLAVLGWIDLPSRLVESLIAASVVVAALNNIRPMIGGRLWTLAFGFGLLHGLGFAGALMDLDLPAGSLAVSLLAFNLGVEAGQVVIVALLLAVAIGLRALQAPPLAWRLGSLAIVLVGALWLIERVFGALPII